MARCVLQCTAPLLTEVVSGLAQHRNVLVAVEKFVVRGRATADQRLTADQVAQLEVVLAGVRFVERPAAAVKPWATDERLARAGLLDACRGMRHARDAARHALFAAVRDLGASDPFSWASR